MKISSTSTFVTTLFLCSLAEFVWGKGPIQFCASFEDENHYRLLLLNQQDTLPHLQSKSVEVPDAIFCDNPFWVHSLWPSFEGDKRSNFKRFNYDLGNPEIIKDQCNDNSSKDSLKKTIIPQLEWNFSNIDGSLYNRNSAETFLRKFYNKTFTGYWMADLACTCPHFEAQHQDRSFKAKLVGKCKPDFKKEKRIIPDDYRKPKKSPEETENKPVTRINNPDWIPCYWKNWQDQCEIENYASRKPLPVHGNVSGIDESLECYLVDGKFYLNFATNVPHQEINKFCYTDSTNCAYRNPPPELEGDYYSCKKFNLVEGGCELEPHGIDFVIDENLRYEGWNRNGMHYYFKHKTELEFEEFLDNILFRSESLIKSYKEILPEGISEKDILRMGDEAAQKTHGIFFYDGRKKIRYEKFEKTKFKTLEDAMKYCKAQWK